MKKDVKKKTLVKHHSSSKKESIPAQDGLGTELCNGAGEISRLSVIGTSRSEIMCSRLTAPPRGPAACSVPNDPLHITTHDAVLPGHRRNDSLIQKNKSSCHEICVVFNSMNVILRSFPFKIDALLQGSNTHFDFFIDDVAKDKNAFTAMVI